MELIYHILFLSILLPGILLLLPSFLKELFKNPSSSLVIFLSILLFYFILYSIVTNLKDIPYLNRLEGFQDITADSINLKSILQGSISDICLNCMIKSHTNLYSTTCLKDCSTPTGTIEKCNSCFNTNLPQEIDKTCKNDCNKISLDTLYDSKTLKFKDLSQIVKLKREKTEKAKRDVELAFAADKVRRDAEEKAAKEKAAKEKEQAKADAAAEAEILIAEKDPNNRSYALWLWTSLGTGYKLNRGYYIIDFNGDWVTDEDCTRCVAGTSLSLKKKDKNYNEWAPCGSVCNTSPSRAQFDNITPACATCRKTVMLEMKRRCKGRCKANMTSGCPLGLYLPGGSGIDTSCFVQAGLKYDTNTGKWA